MLIPLRTDAPIYHAPWATIAIIVANVLLQVWASATDYEHVDPWLIEYGAWLPWQWISSAFLHAGWMHLIGNMVFLWVFGLVVEGKIGWWRFLAVYLGIAAASGMVEQTIMLWGEGGSLGASGVIFGLMAIAMVWAPENEIDSVLLFFGVRHIELEIKVFAWIYLGLQILYAVLDGFAIGSAALHLIGAAAGLPIGIVMLRRGWVDCEGWDWFSRRRGDAPRAGSAKPILAASPPPDQMALDAEYRASFTEMLSAGNAAGAIQVWQAHHGERWNLPIALRERLVGLLVKAERIADARPVLDGILVQEPGHAAMGLLRAQLLLRERRPAAALETLDRIAATAYDERQRALDARLRAQAARLQADGVLEIAS